MINNQLNFFDLPIEIHFKIFEEAKMTRNELLELATTSKAFNSIVMSFFEDNIIK